MPPAYLYQLSFKLIPIHPQSRRCYNAYAQQNKDLKKTVEFWKPFINRNIVFEQGCLSFNRSIAEETGFGMDITEDKGARCDFCSVQEEITL